MDSRSKLKCLNFQAVFRFINIAILTHLVSANIIDQNSINFQNDQYSTKPYNHDSNFHDSASNQLSNDSIPLQIQNTADQYASVLLQPNQVHSHRYKRSITISSTHTPKSISMVMIENQISKLQKQLLNLTTSIWLSVEDKLRITAIDTITKDLRVMLENLQKEYEENSHEKDQRIQNITQKLKTATILAIVLSINASQFSIADQQLQVLTDDSIYQRIVQKVYLQHADMFNLLLSFGGSIIDIERKFKIYEALYHEMRTNNQIDIQKLLQLSQSVRKGVRDLATGTIQDKSRSFIRTLWKENQELTLTLISVTFLKNESQNWPTIKLLNDEIRKSSSFKVFGDLYDDAIEKIWNTMSIGQILFVAHQITVMAEERIIIHESIFRKLQGDGKLYTDDVLPLVRYMKATWEDPGFNSVDWQSRYKFIINKLPRSLRNIVLHSTVCIKYSHYNEYLYAEESKKEYNFDEKYQSVFTWIPKGKSKLPEFKWKLIFIHDSTCTIVNVKYYNKSLGQRYYTNEINNTNYINYSVLDSVVPNYWFFHVDGDGVQISRGVKNFYLFADGKRDENRRNVFAYDCPTKPSYPLKWDFTDCTD